MEVIPAIDLKNGACVRLYQGDFEQTTVFSTDPEETALRWERAGATRIHVVDLEGSRSGVPTNLEAIRAIVGAASIPVQVGGGIRNIESARALLEAGVERVVLGTAAVKDPSLVEEICRRWGTERVIIAVDARAGKVAIKGWTEDTSVDATELVKEMAALGPRRFLYTDISRDGTMSSPNFGATAALVENTGMSIIASGGVSRLEDVRRVVETGAEAVIVGRALYEGTVDLAEAIEVARG